MNKLNSNFIKSAIEAMLFVSPKSISFKQIYKALPDVPKNIIQIQIYELIKEYRKRITSIEIVIINNKLEMLLKPEFNKFNLFATGTKLKKSELKTLALISLNSPVKQEDILKQRPYNTLKILKDLDLISVKKVGRKNILETTKKFNLLFNKKEKFK